MATSLDAPHSEIIVRNWQRRQPLDTDAVCRLALEVLQRMNTRATLGIEFMSSRRMAQLNWDFLRHEGSTDVITFDHGSSLSHLQGDIAIGMDDAVKQAAQFQTTWPEEVARYVIHGILHLKGYDDLTPAKRRIMKREENRWLRFAKARGLHALETVHPKRAGATARRPAARKSR